MKATDIIGGCLCGSVRYTCDADPLDPHICHCNDCRKQSGTAFAMIIDVPREALQLSGRPLSHIPIKATAEERWSESFVTNVVHLCLLSLRLTPILYS